MAVENLPLLREISTAFLTMGSFGDPGAGKPGLPGAGGRDRDGI